MDYKKRQAYQKSIQQNLRIYFEPVVNIKLYNHILTERSNNHSTESGILYNGQ